MKQSLFKIRDDKDYRNIVIDSICLGTNQSELKDSLNYFLDHKLHLFNNEIFKGSFYEGDDEFLDLLLPSIRRVWSKFFVNQPEILTDLQLALYKQSFSIDHFTDYLLDILPKVKNCLVHFEELDRTAETLTLIVDNYAANFIRKCIESTDIVQDIRDLKLNKISK